MHAEIGYEPGVLVFVAVVEHVSVPVTFPAWPPIEYVSDPELGASPLTGGVEPNALDVLTVTVRSGVSSMSACAPAPSMQLPLLQAAALIVRPVALRALTGPLSGFPCCVQVAPASVVAITVPNVPAAKQFEVSRQAIEVRLWPLPIVSGDHVAPSVVCSITAVPALAEPVAKHVVEPGHATALSVVVTPLVDPDHVTPPLTEAMIVPELPTAKQFELEPHETALSVVEPEPPPALHVLPSIVKRDAPAAPTTAQWVVETHEMPLRFDAVPLVCWIHVWPPFVGRQDRAAIADREAVRDGRAGDGVHLVGRPAARLLRPRGSARGREERDALLTGRVADEVPLAVDARERAASAVAGSRGPRRAVEGVDGAVLADRDAEGRSARLAVDAVEQVGRVRRHRRPGGEVGRRDDRAAAPDRVAGRRARETRDRVQIVARARVARPQRPRGCRRRKS